MIIESIRSDPYPVILFLFKKLGQEVRPSRETKRRTRFALLVFASRLDVPSIRANVGNPIINHVLPAGDLIEILLPNKYLGDLSSHIDLRRYFSAKLGLAVLRGKQP